MTLRSSAWVWLLTAGVAFGQGAPATRPQTDGFDPGQQVPPLQRRSPQDLATIQATARLVILDVVVTDSKGKPVTGLKQSDFTLLEDDSEQKIASFTEHGPVDPAVAAKSITAQKLPPDVFTNLRPTGNGDSSTVILMDALDTSPIAQMYLREQVIQYMKTVQPGTQMAIFQLDTGLHMIQGMTGDPEALREAANGKRDQVVQTPIPGGLGNPNAVRIKQDILIQGIQSLAQYLSTFPGRKNLIWFTGQVPFYLYGPSPSNPFVDEQESIEQMGKLTDALRLNRVAIYPIDARGLRTDPRFSAANGAKPSFSMPSSSFGLNDAADHSYLDDVAQKTGGKAFYNTNGLKEAIGDIVDIGSHFYTLAFAPSNKTMDGRYRKLKVMLAQQGLSLEYRRGYYAVRDPGRTRNPRLLQAQAQAQAAPYLPNETQEERTARMTMQGAMKMGAAPSRQIVFFAKVTPQADVEKDKKGTAAEQGNYMDEKLRAKGYRNYKVHYSIDTRAMRFMPAVDGSYHDKLEYVAEVFDNQGERLNGVIDKASVDIDGPTYQRMVKSGMGADQTIAMPAKGMFFLRLGVHDVNGNLVGTMEIPTESIKPLP